MRFLIVTNLYPPQELGGYGRSMADFAWGLLRRGHYVEVLLVMLHICNPKGLPLQSGDHPASSLIVDSLLKVIINEE